MENTVLGNTGKKDITLFAKIVYGMGDLASQLIWTFVGTYLTVFYTDIVGVTPAIASTIILGARIWDGVNDPMFGAIAERTRNKMGRFRPYILYGAPVLAILNVLCFITPSAENMTAKVVWVTITYILLGMLYTVVNLSYGSLSMVMTYDPQERTDLNAWRMIGTNVGAVVLNVVSMPLLLHFSGVGDGRSYNAHGFFMVAILFSALALPMFWLLFFKSKEVVQPVAGAEKVQLRESIKVIFTNKPLMCLFAIMLFIMTGFFGRMGIVIYYYIYIIHRFDLISLLMMLPPLVTAASILVTKNFAEKVGRKKMIVIGFVGSAICLAGVYFVDPTNIPLLIAFTAGYGVFGFPAPLLMASVPEAIDYAEDKTGIRADGSSYAVVSLATKFGSAFGVSVGLIIMGAFGYVAHAEQTQEAMTGINVASNLLPAILYLVALIPLFMYPLNSEKNAEIRQRLMAKNSKANKHHS